MDLKKFVKDIPDFPSEGVIFRDVTPLLQDSEAYQYTIDALCDFARKVQADVIVGPEARGFLFGCPTAYALNIGFVPIRKPGKLPRETISVSYDLEYGSNILHMHKDALKPGQRVVLIDDLLATGGTIQAGAKLVESLGAVVAGMAFVIELDALKGRELLHDYEVMSLMHY
ncbi:Adenine phosphoribosyltransferase [Clostridiales bacterium CHKCI006]|nr:Adenine phosphoribosyltransferase [Clostridiales bacterium CHKCI006]